MAGEEKDRRPLMVTRRHPRSPVSEAFRTLRTNLGYISPDRPLKSLLVTSSGPEEGKSTVTANLAVVLAQAGSRVLVVDADLRKPVMHKAFELDNRRGLTNALVEDLDPAELIRPTGLPGLFVLTSGPIPPNPAELLGSARMQRLLPALTSNYDLVLVDTPPVLAVTDAAVLAPLVDGAVLVARAGITRLDLLQEAKETLERTGVRLLGAVLNGLKPDTDGYYYYHYRYYYAHGERRSGAEASEAEREQ
ncbi:MAG: CpsD/CapB family tyrosine-protein kinase [Moorellales bacterium]